VGIFRPVPGWFVFPALPALTRWAMIFRPCGAGAFQRAEPFGVRYVSRRNTRVAVLRGFGAGAFQRAETFGVRTSLGGTHALRSCAASGLEVSSVQRHSDLVTSTGRTRRPWRWRIFNQNGGGIKAHGLVVEQAQVKAAR